MGKYMWMYRELISCPLVLTIGRFIYNNIEGYVTLPILNLRLNILRDSGGELFTFSNIPHGDWREHVREVCYAIFTSKLHELDPMSKLEALTMFHGGIGIYVVLGDKILPISLDFINRKNTYFYLKPRPLGRDYVESSLENWLMLSFTLREGIYDLSMKICNRIYDTSNETCSLKTNHGVLLITTSIIRDPDYIRVYPDNSPLRHVISVE